MLNYMSMFHAHTSPNGQKKYPINRPTIAVALLNFKKNYIAM